MQRKELEKLGIRKLNSAKKKYKDGELDLIPKDSQ